MSEAITITKQDLAEIVAAAVKAARTPNVIEQKKIDDEQRAQEQAQAARKNLSGQVKADIEQKKAIQAICSHEHANGDTHAVYIQESKGPGYFLCQKNQCIIRPGVAPENYKGTDMFDTVLFNRLFQKARNNEIFG